MTQDKTGLLIAALVAIVAIVGLVVLLNGGTGAVVIKGDLGTDFATDELYADNSHCYFVGTQVCPNGVECVNLKTEEIWCN